MALLTDHPDPGLLWQHRRRHSYTALWAAILQTACLITLGVNDPQVIAALTPLITPTYMLWGTVIIAYIANCAVEAYIDRRPK